ncbi:hypothetical protein ACFPM0_00720 [Pseudonocardia sulfidoxydans]
MLFTVVLLGLAAGDVAVRAPRRADRPAPAELAASGLVTRCAEWFRPR